MPANRISARVTPAPAPSPGSVIAGIAAAIAMQVMAAAAAFASMAIVLMAAFANFGSYGAEQESTWWVIFAVPLAVGAIAAYVMSGFAASKVMGTGLGWLMLLTGPAMLLLLAMLS